MNYEYHCPKKLLSSENTSSISIFFHNGDFIKLQKREIIDISLNLYDRLQYDGREYSPVAESGILKLQIRKQRTRYESTYLYNAPQFKRDRKAAIESRCMEGGISHIAFFNENNWHISVYGEIAATLDGEYLCLHYLPKATGGTHQGTDHSIKLAHPQADAIRYIHLIFENCESFDIYQEEILAMQLDLSPELVWSSGGYTRVIRGGSMRIKLVKTYTGRGINLHSPKNVLLKHLEHRLYGTGIDNIDICGLGVYYDHPNYVNLNHEHFLIEQLPLDDFPEEDYYILPYISGYAERQSDDSILIVFGETMKAE